MVLLFNIWSKYDNFAYLMPCVKKFAWHVYFLANLKYANKLLKHMSHGYIHTCPQWLDTLPTYLHLLAHWTLNLLIILIMTDFVESKVGCMHIWFDHMPIKKIHISPAAMMRGMFCKFCLQTFIYSSKTPAIFFKWFILQN